MTKKRNGAAHGNLTAADLARTMPTRDNRKEPRFACGRTLAILPVASTAMEEWKFVPANLLDCSRSGLALLTSIPFGIGDQFMVKLKLVKLILVEYTVRHCVKNAASEYKIGAELTGYVGAPEDSTAVLDALLSPSPP